MVIERFILDREDMVTFLPTEVIFVAEFKAISIGIFTFPIIVVRKTEKKWPKERDVTNVWIKNLYA